MRKLKLSAYTLCSCLGQGKQEHRDALFAECAGLRQVDFENIDLQTWIGRVHGVEDVVLPEKLRAYECRNNRLAQLAIESDNFVDSVRLAVSRYGTRRIGLFIGTSTSGVLEAEYAYAARDLAQDILPKDFSYNTTQAISSVGYFVRQLLRLEGPIEVVSTACSSSANVFAAAHRFMSAGFCDAAIVGGVDSLCQMTLYGFDSLQLVSQLPCRPCDRDRDGMNVGEAAGFAILEWEDSNAELCLLGYGESSDAWHMSAPDPTGAGAALAIRAALTRAGLEPLDIDYINLHGSATVANDLAEDAAVFEIFGGCALCSSTKGFTGHVLGAAGIIEALFSCLAVENDVAFRTINTVNVDDAISSPILLETYRTSITNVMSNSFGFGGSNMSLIFGRPS